MADNPTPIPTAAPPITIGALTNVPAPGSPIRSDWPQSISTLVTQLTAYFNAQVAGPEVQLFSGGSIATIGSVTLLSTGNYLCIGSATLINRGSTVQQASVNMRVNGGQVGAAGVAWLNAPNEAVTVPLVGLTNVASGVRALDIIGTSTGSMFVQTRQISLLRIQ